MSHSIPAWQAKGLAHAACPQVIGKPSCLALTINRNGISPACVGSTCGLAPADLQAAYHLPSGTKGAGQIVAIVDFNDNPNVASDLAAYRSEFGLGTANFTKYNEDGQIGNYPPPDPGWGVEIDLDVDMVSAVCPKCTIALIESAGNIQAAEQTAANLGAHVVSNSWGCPQSDNCGDPNFSTYFNIPGVLYLASSGDSGYQGNHPGAPTALADVVSVGGTQLMKSGSTYSEIAWDGAGSGCATDVTKPSWQHDTGCAGRTVSDISAEAGCSPGVAEYDSYQAPGWIGECGTSAASPIVAASYALGGKAQNQDAAAHIWKLKKKLKAKDLHDITSGSNGSCGGSYLCTAGTGYDGPTGWGSPNGVKGL